MNSVTVAGTGTGRERHLVRADPRLENLYAISKLLTRFQSVEQTLGDVIAIVAQTLDLRSVIFILEGEGSPRTILWQARGEQPHRLLLARAHAQLAYGYFASSSVDFKLTIASPLDLPRRPDQEAEGEAEATGTEKYFVLLPLVDSKGAIFGALQCEGVRPWEEHHLVFLDAVVNQLAIAIDRQASISAQQAATERVEKEQRLLAEFSAVIGASLDVQDIVKATARFAVPALADICIVDQLGEDGKTQRFEVAFADGRQERQFADQIRRCPPQPGGETSQARVMASRTALLLSQVAESDLEGIAHEDGHQDGHEGFIPALGIASMMVVPLLARGRTLGVVTFCAAQSGRRYSAHEVGQAEELVRRAAMAVDNARLYGQAQRATAARDNLLSLVSHDLKNYAAACLFSSASLLNDSQAEPGQRIHKQILVVQRSVLKIDRLLNDLLQTASIEAGAFTVDKHRTDIAPVIAEAIEALQPLATSKEQVLTSELPAQLPMVFGDVGRIQQVLANLLGNAIKFTPNKGAIVVRASATEGDVTVSVKDTGPGIAPDEIPHLFTRFWQTKRTARLGTGLGLFIVKGIVEAHGGRVSVEGGLGTGSTFSFTIPLAKTEDVSGVLGLRQGDRSP